MQERLKTLANQWSKSAETLRSEVKRGIALRQSAEEKLARAEALDTCADQMRRLITPYVE